MTASLAWQPHPETWLLVSVLVIAYVSAVSFVGPKLVPPGKVVATTAQKSCFLLGVFALLLAEAWPLHEIAEQYLFSGHMVQHILFAFVAPPLLLLGIPVWMFRALLGKGLRFEIFRFLSKPAIGFLMFNMVIAAMHWSPVVNLQSSSALFHFAFHLTMITAGLCMWTNVVTPLPELGRMSEPVKMMYLFLTSIIPTVPASFLTFSESSFYSTYADGSTTLGHLRHHGPTRGRAAHEDRGRFATVGRHRGDVLPLVREGRIELRRTGRVAGLRARARSVRSEEMMRGSTRKAASKA